MKPTDFTRKRKQPFASTLLFMLNLLRKSLVVEINNFVTHLNKKFSLKQQLQSFTSSAFIQNRKKIKPEIFKYLSEVIINNYYLETNEDIQLFKGFRILAVDGSQLTLPFTKELRKLYGEATNASEIIVVNAKVSVLYDVLNRLALDSVIAHVDTGERELALTHFTKLKKNDLIIYDRGYPSYDFIHEHVKRNLDYLIRVKIMHSSIVTAFVQSGKRTVTTQMLPKSKQSLKGKEYNKDTGIEVRLVRVDLPSGETEVLVTSLLDCQKYPAGMFKKLYFLRWSIETFYDELKNKLKVEHFTGYSAQSIQQDFFCAIFICNLKSVIVNDLQEELAIQNEGKKYVYKINTNVSYGFLKNRILDLLLLQAPLETVHKELETLLLENTIPIRNNRTNPRERKKYKNRVKPKVFKNQRDAI